MAQSESPVLLPSLHPAQTLTKWIEGTGAWSPWIFAALFIGASFLMIWRLECMSEEGFEGTVLGTLIMPYCSGMGNLIFAFILGQRGGAGTGADVMTNSLVNNITNMTLLIGLPTIFWGMAIIPVAKKNKNGKSGKMQKTHQINRLSLLLTLTAVLFFTGVTWALARDGKLDSNDGLVLVGLFLFWQCFHVFDVLKHNVRTNKSFGWLLPLDLILLGVGAFAIYVSTDWLVTWISKIHTGFISAKHMGWLSGWLMVLPNAILAIYYGWRGRPEVVFTSQVSDGHICIPLCVGVFALYRTLIVPSFFLLGVQLLLAATLLHILFVVVFGKLPRAMGWALIGVYGFFLWKGLK